MEVQTCEARKCGHDRAVTLADVVLTQVPTGSHQQPRSGKWSGRSMAHAQPFADLYTSPAPVECPTPCFQTSLTCQPPNSLLTAIPAPPALPPAAALSSAGWRAVPTSSGTAAETLPEAAPSEGFDPAPCMHTHVCQGVNQSQVVDAGSKQTKPSECRQGCVQSALPAAVGSMLWRRLRGSVRRIACNKRCGRNPRLQGDWTHSVSTDCRRQTSAGSLRMPLLDSQLQP